MAKLELRLLSVDVEVFEIVEIKNDVVWLIIHIVP